MFLSVVFLSLVAASPWGTDEIDGLLGPLTAPPTSLPQAQRRQDDSQNTCGYASGSSRTFCMLFRSTTAILSYLIILQSCPSHTPIQTLYVPRTLSSVFMAAVMLGHSPHALFRQHALLLQRCQRLAPMKLVQSTTRLRNVQLLDLRSVMNGYLCMIYQLWYVP